MTAPRQDRRPSLPDTEPTDLVTFSDDTSLQRRLDRRDAERRRCERRGVEDAATGARLTAELGARELCHDLRQPLASAVVLTHMLGREVGLTPAGSERLELLRRELARLGAMLSAQLEPAPPVLVDLATVARAVASAPADPAATAVELRCSDVPLVLGDPVQLTRLVANLVANARSAAGDCGRVLVRVTRDDGGACLAVEDSGDAAGEPSPSGCGLGLLIVDAVVRRHGGRSTCTPSGLGGLRIAVTLPPRVPQQDGGAAT